MPRTVTGPERTAIQSGHANVAVKLWVEDPDGTYKDVDVSLDGSGFHVLVVLEDDIDANCMTMTATVVREVSPTQSLAPLMEDSTLNIDVSLAYAPFLDVGRKWKVDVSVIEYGGAHSYTTIAEGVIDTVDVRHPQNEVVITGRDLGASLLDFFIEAEREHPVLGTFSMEGVIAEILSTNLASPPAVYTPVSPGFTMNFWLQQQESLMTAINTIAQLAAFVVRYRFDASDVHRLTLYEPDRGASVEDWTIGPDEYTALPTAAINIDRVRNKITVRYFRDSTGLVETVTSSDATSIARYGGPLGIERILQVDVSRDAQITTNTRATALADAILSDLKDPPFLQEVQVPNFWPVQLGDYIKFTANGVHYDTDQFGAVNHIRHEISGGQMMTTLQCGGQPRGRYTAWQPATIRKAPDLPTGQGAVAIATDGGGAFNFDWPDWVLSSKHATSTSAFPTLATVRSSGTSADGQQVSFTFAAATLALGASIYITAIPYSQLASEGYEGPPLKLKATRHDFSASKTVFYNAARMRILPDGAETMVDTNAYMVPSGGLDSKSPALISDLILPEGVTMTNVSWYVYQSGTSNFVRCNLARLDTSAGWGFVDLAGNDDTTNVGQQVVQSTISESTTGRRYRVLAQFIIQPGGGATDTSIRMSGYSITYTMPSTLNAI